MNKLGEMWYQGLTPENVRAEFEATGVFPVNKEKFPTSRFDERLMSRYKNWVKAGKPKDGNGYLCKEVDPKKAIPKEIYIALFFSACIR